MFKEVDCRGQECPKPVIMTKAALEELQDGVLVTIVDNTIARDNVLRLAESLKLKAEVREVSGDYQVAINKTGGSGSACAAAVEAILNPKATGDNYVLFLQGNTLGRGDDKLGAMLMKSLLFTAASHDVAPKAVLMLNSAVQLACRGSEVLDSLIALEAKGVEIISCGTCLDYFKLKDQLAVGRIGNMYDIFAMAAKYPTITL